ncbi:MAG TPA: hypothetical protein VGV16_01515 [Gammaproteobacteria bacterium]|nr:hypothetical protein [Gammaproteobacteria bacterium]
MKGTRRTPSNVLPFQRHEVPRGFVAFSQRLLLWQEALGAFRRLAEKKTGIP